MNETLFTCFTPTKFSIWSYMPVWLSDIQICLYLLLTTPQNRIFRPKEQIISIKIENMLLHKQSIDKDKKYLMHNVFHRSLMTDLPNFVSFSSVFSHIFSFYRCLAEWQKKRRTRQRTSVQEADIVQKRYRCGAERKLNGVWERRLGVHEDGLRMTATAVDHVFTFLL